MNRSDWSLPIELDDLILRRADERDTEALCKLYSEPEVCRYQFWTSEQFQEGILEEEFEVGAPGVPLFLAIISKEHGGLIGDCQLTIESSESRQGEIGFSLHPSFWGRGYATRAVGATFGFGFDFLDLHRIYGATDIRNERCWRLMERVGMRREAHFQEDNFYNDEWLSSYVYAILKKEWSG